MLPLILAVLLTCNTTVIDPEPEYSRYQQQTRHYVMYLIENLEREKLRRSLRHYEDDGSELKLELPEWVRIEYVRDLLPTSYPN